MVLPLLASKVGVETVKEEEDNDDTIIESDSDKTEKSGVSDNLPKQESAIDVNTSNNNAILICMVRTAD